MNALRALVMLVLALSSPCLAAKFDYDVARQSVVTIYCDTSKGFGGGVITSRTTIVTVAHVVNQCSEVRIGYYDHTTAIGKVMEVDSNRDLARILPERTPDLINMAELAIESPVVGETLHTISHPAGLTWTYTRVHLASDGDTQTDVGDSPNLTVYVVAGPWAPGFSGGGLFNDDGRVVGLGEGGVKTTSFSFYVPSAQLCQKLIKCKARS